jgi:hypothetical protein
MASPLSSLLPDGGDDDNRSMDYSDDDGDYHHGSDSVSDDATSGEDDGGSGGSGEIEAGVGVGGGVDDGASEETPTPTWVARIIPKAAYDWLFPPTSGYKTRNLARTARAGCSSA